MTATIRFDQVGLSAGVAGVARTDGLDTGAKVTVTNAGGLPCRCEFWWKPPDDSSAVLAQVNDTTWEFTPQAGRYGEYIVRMIEAEGLLNESEDIKVFGIRLPVSGLLVTGLNSRGEPSVNLASSALEKLAAGITAFQNEPLPDNAAINYANWWQQMRELFLAVETIASGTSSQDAATFKWEYQGTGTTPTSGGFTINSGEFRMHDTTQDAGPQGGTLQELFRYLSGYVYLEEEGTPSTNVFGTVGAAIDNGTYTSLPNFASFNANGSLVVGRVYRFTFQRGLNLASPSVSFSGTGVVDQLDPTGFGETTVVYMTGVGTVTLRGIKAPITVGNSLGKRRIVLHVSQNTTLTVVNNQGAPVLASDRVLAHPATNITVSGTPTFAPRVVFDYDDTNALWIMSSVIGVAGNWVGLTDTPASFTANAVYRANAGATALETSGITVAGTVTTFPGNNAHGNNNIAGVKSFSYNGEVNNGDVSGSVMIDFTLGQKQRIRMTGNVTGLDFTFPSGTASGFVLMIEQDDVGGRTVAFANGSTKQARGAALDVSGGADEVTGMFIHWDGTMATITTIPDLTASPTVSLV